MGTRITETRPKIGDFLVRGYVLDDQLHFYFKAELADPGYETLIPWCQADEMYPERHPRVEVPRHYMASHGFCLDCSKAFERAEAAIGTPT